MRDLVSVIITTKNEQEVLENLLKSVTKQSYKNIEIILVDNKSSDKTLEIAKKYTKKTFTKGPERSVQRNYGVSQARGNYVLILDADMQLEKNAIAECISGMGNKEVGALVIPEKSIGEGFWAKCKAFEREFYVGEDSIEAARFFRKDLFNKFGGYDKTITGPEDWDLPMRMKKKGIKIGRINSYIIHNERHFSVWKSAKKKFYYAAHAKVFLKRHPETALNQGNLLFRPVFFKKWKKIVLNPVLSLGMFFMRLVEMSAAVLGIILSLR